jgi:colanic acid biosynthesis glycosyl transferase WcaI
MVGIIHPCKIYGAMAVGKPILFLGPKPSHVSDLLDAHMIGLHVSHGDVNATVAAIETLQATPAKTLSHMGETARQVLNRQISQAILCGRFCDHLEQAFAEKGATLSSERKLSCAPS